MQLGNRGAIQDFTDVDIDVQYNLNVYALIKIVQLFVDDIRKVKMAE